jgi:predicted acetyltransferase
MNQYEIKYLKDSEVDKATNDKLISILTECFPEQPIFEKQRFFKDMPDFRWFIEENEEVIAHVALHIKSIIVGKNEIHVGGIAEVCVRSMYRKKGLAKKIMNVVHEWLIQHKYKYAMLFGYENIYSSSGYFSIENDIRFIDYKTRQIRIENNIDGMVKLLSSEPWPEGLVDLRGFTF